MAEIVEAFVDHIKTQSTVTNLVGTRVYAYEAGDGAIDSYVVVTNPTNPRAAFTQTDYGGTGRVTIYCYARTVSSAQTLGNAVLDLYKSHHGAVDDITVEWIEVSNARMLHGPNREFRYIVDLVVHYT